MNRRILFIADLQHATPRVVGFIKYFKKFGWKVEVLDLGMGREAIIGTAIDENRIVSRIKNTSVLKHNYIKILANNVIALLRLLSLVIKITIKNKYHNGLKRPDIIFSSSSPFECHVLASNIKTQWKHVLWVADYRDLWSYNHNNTNQWSIVKNLQLAIESRVLKSANSVCTVSEAWTKRMESLIKKNTMSVTIRNGFFNLPSRTKVIARNSILRHTGTLYENLQKKNLEKVFEAVKILSKKNPAILLELWGSKQNWVQSLIDECECNKWVIQKGPVPHRKSVQLQRGAMLNILIGLDNSSFSEGYYLKLFEYIGNKRPFVYVTHSEAVDDSSEKIIENIPYGWVAKKISTICETFDLINQSTNMNSICTSFDISRFSLENSAHILDKHLQSLLDD